MLITILIILIIVTLGTGLYLCLLLRQIKGISDQLEFLEDHASRMRITTDIRNRQTLALVERINQHIDNTHKLNLKLRRKELVAQNTITGLSHDIRTPLTSLDGYLQLLKETDDPEKSRQYIEVMQNRVASLTRILDELFTYAKLQQDSYTLDLEPVNLSEILAHNLFSFYEDFHRKGCNPRVVLPDEAVEIRANSIALERIIQNLIKNALVHGTGDIEIKLSISEDGNPQAVLKVRNRIPENSSLQQENLFELFYKADPTRQSSSTGLGLAIARGLAEKMDTKLTASVKDNYFEAVFRAPVIK